VGHARREGDFLLLIFSTVAVEAQAVAGEAVFCSSSSILVCVVCSGVQPSVAIMYNSACSVQLLSAALQALQDMPAGGREAVQFRLQQQQQQQPWLST